MKLDSVLLGFLWPTNIISQLIVALIILLFIVFLYLRHQSKKHIYIASKLLKIFDSDDAINFLVKTAHDPRRGSDSNPEILFKHTISIILSQFISLTKQNTTTKENDNPSQAIYDKTKDNPIIKHIRSIFVAGCNESRLETDALLKYTENELFNEIFRLKNILAAFIVIGLLGTLIGLGESLSQLSPVLNSTNTQKIDIASSLANLLNHLKSAFAPSVWGILCTIIGMFFYVRFVHSYCNPLQSQLQHLTLNVWIPRLYPGISQKLIEALTDNTTKFVEHVKDAAAVAGFAKEIKEKTGTYMASLHDGQTLLEQLATQIAHFQVASQSLSNFSYSFEKSVQSLTGFQGQLLQLQQDLSGSINNAVDFQNSRIEGLYNNIMQVSKTLQIVDETYAKNVVEFNELVSSVKKGKNIESQKNREISESILNESSKRFEQIEVCLNNNLLNMTEQLNANHTKLLDKFESQDTPIKNAAVKIEKSAENIDNYHLKLAQRLVQNNDNLSSQLQAIANQIKDNNELFLSRLGDRNNNSSSQNDLTNQLIKELKALNESINKPFWNKLLPKKVR